MLVQFEESVPGGVFGEVNLPTLPVEGQYMYFEHIQEDGEPVEFRVARASWNVEGDIAEGSVILRRT